MTGRWFLGLLSFVGTAFAATTVTKVIELHYLSANKVLNLVQPLMQNGELINGAGQTLVLKVRPQTLSEIRAILHQIDVPPVQFRITIHQDGPDWINAQKNHDVVYSTQSLPQNPRNQSVAVMNGESALVSTDQEVPIIQAIGLGFYPGVVYQQHSVQTGLLVQPVLQGSQVRLALKRIRQQRNFVGGQQFDEQQIDTTVMVPINKWVALGAAEGDELTEASSRVYSAGRSFVQNSTLYIRVSLIGSN